MGGLFLHLAKRNFAGYKPFSGLTCKNRVRVLVRGNGQQMEHAIQRIVVVGSGSAGWITAGLLAAEHGHESAADFSVTLLESPNVPIIGVGEGTWPSMRSTLQKLGLSEIEFLRECDASFKQGTEFVNWSNHDARKVIFTRSVCRVNLPV